MALSVWHFLRANFIRREMEKNDEENIKWKKNVMETPIFNFRASV